MLKLSAVFCVACIVTDFNFAIKFNIAHKRLMAAQLIDGPSYLDPKVIKIQEFRDYIVSAQDG